MIVSKFQTSATLKLHACFLRNNQFEAKASHVNSQILIRHQPCLHFSTGASELKFVLTYCVYWLTPWIREVPGCAVVWSEVFVSQGIPVGRWTVSSKQLDSVMDKHPGHSKNNSVVAQETKNHPCYFLCVTLTCLSFKFNRAVYMPWLFWKHVQSKQAIAGPLHQKTTLPVSLVFLLTWRNAHHSYSKTEPLFTSWWLFDICDYQHHSETSVYNETLDWCLEIKLRAKTCNLCDS